MTMSLDKMANVYDIKSKTLYPFEYFKDANSCNNILGNLSIEHFRSSLTNNLSLQAEVDEFKRSNSKKIGKDITLEYMENDARFIRTLFQSVC